MHTIWKAVDTTYIYFRICNILLFRLNLLAKVRWE